MRSLRTLPILMLASALLVAQTATTDPNPKVSTDLNSIVAAGASPRSSSAIPSASSSATTSSASWSTSVNVIVQFNTPPSAGDLNQLA